MPIQRTSSAVRREALERGSPLLAIRVYPKTIIGQEELI